MILIEDYPNDPLVAKYVDRYQYFNIKEKGYFKTIPNGKIELYIIKSGEFRVWDEDSNTFNSSLPSGFIPATAKMSLYEVRDQLICFNIKFNLGVLSLSKFEGLLKDWSARKVSEVIPQKEIEAIRQMATPGLDTLPVSKLDQVLKNMLNENQVNNEINQLIHHLEDHIHEEFRVTILADQMSMSPKTLERLTKKHFNLTPKNLWKVIRFEHATSHVKRSHTQKLIEALSYGFYDQSHFIKECKKITGYPPKEFFSKLKLSTNDIMFETENHKR